MSDGPSDWRRVKAWVADLLEADGAERVALEARLAAEPATIRERVAALVAAADGGEDALDALDPRVALRGARRDWTGESIGGFTVERFVARGGMGEVYEARQQGTGRRVAIKLLSGHSPRERQRFQLEGRLLGRLEHPNIASVVEADVHRTEDGVHWPYLALDFVDGVPITRAAREAGLTTHDALRLFADVCRGVEHAHRRGVVHRDLKPDNVLVTAAAEGGGPVTPKILDFGVAALTDGGLDESTTRLTREGDLIGTLAYMAPEQVEGRGAIDGRTDVHALGALLYELLTGRQPFELAGLTLTECLRLLRDTDAPRASIADPRLRGDLDTIVRTAMAREPERRYASARALADDVERFLAHEPIAARPPGALYVATKFVRRHRVLVAATATALVLLSLGLVGTGLGLALARDEARHAADVNAFLGDILTAPNAWDLGRDAGFGAVFDHFAPQVRERFPDHPGTRASLHTKLGWAYSRLGRGVEAVEQLELGALASAEAFGELHPSTLRALRELHNLHLTHDAEWPGAREATQEHLATCRRVLGPTHEDTLLALGNVGLAHSNAGDYERAIAAFEDAVASARSVAGSLQPANLDSLISNLAAIHNQFGDPTAALPLLEELAARLGARLEADHVTVLRNRHNLAFTYTSLGLHARALEECRALEPAYARAFGPGHPDTDALVRTRGVALLGLGRTEEAIADLERASAQGDRRDGELHPEALMTLNNLCVAYANAGRFEDCASCATELADRCERAVDDGGVGLGARSLLAAMQSELGRDAEAAATFEALVDDFEAVFGPDHPQTLVVVNNLARHLHTRLDAPERAVPLLERAVAGWRAALPDDASTLRRLSWNLGRAQLDAGDALAAERTLGEVAALAELDPAGVVPAEEWESVRARLAGVLLAE